MENFKQTIFNNLSKYKDQSLGITEKGLWRGKGYDYILPKDKAAYNIFEKYRNDFFNSNFKDIKLHMYFNHLNSSQAMCINFFYPLIESKKLHLVLKYIGHEGERVDYNTVEFEKKSKIDGVSNRRPTNFDFYFKTASGIKFYFEIKYTEGAFGRAPSDAEHYNKFEKVYKKYLLKVVKPKYSEAQEFFKYYQIIRNLIHIDCKSYVIFLYPEENKIISKAAEFAKNSILKSEISSHLINLTWEELVEYFLELPNVDKDFINEMKSKYMLGK